MRQSNKQSGQGALLSPKAGDGGREKAADGIESLLPFLRHHEWIFGLFLVAATMIAYLPVWHAGFIWDDDYYVTNNLMLHSLDGLRQIWFEPGATVQYYPLTFTTFWVEYHLWGLNPLGYHLINVLLHSCNAILLWLILRKMDVRGAWLAAGIFALHPVCVESVAWVTERKNTLSGLFYLGSILVALKFWLPDETPLESHMTGCHKASTASLGSWKFYWLAFVFYVCALCSKTTTLPLPAVILLLVWWKRARVIWQDVYPLGPFLAVGTAMGLITMHVEKHLGAAGNEQGLTWLQGCLLAGRDVWFYLGKLFWPHPLISIYPRWTIQISEWTAYVPVLALVAGLSILWWKRNSWGRPPLVAVLYFVALLFLVLGFFNVSYFRYSFVADHFQYLAGIGPLALAAAGIMMALGVFRKRNLWLKPVFCGTLLLTLGVLTWRQCRIYADAETLWRTTLDRNSACWLAHNNLGDALLQRGDVDGAITHLQKALQFKPDNARAHYNFGNALFEKGDVDEAITHYQEALQFKPDFAEAHNNLGNALFQKGNMGEAITHLQQALQFKPDFAEAHNNLGNILLQRGKTDDAIAHFQRAIAIQPDYAAAHYNLGTALFQKGQMDEAIVQFQRALAIQPDYAKALNNLGNVLFQKGQLDEAIIQFQKALAIQPGFVEAQNGIAHIAWVLATSPDPSVRNGTKAVELAQQTDRLSGDKNPVMPATLAAAYAETGRFPEAITTVQRALQLASSQNNAAMAAALEAQLKLYQTGSAFRDTGASR
jgi:tetratricopeptide (TPR) repeat protein